MMPLNMGQAKFIMIILDKFKVPHAHFFPLCNQVHALVSYRLCCRAWFKARGSATFKNVATWSSIIYLFTLIFSPMNWIERVQFEDSEPKFSVSILCSIKQTERQFI